MEKELHGAKALADALGATAERLDTAIVRALNRTIRSLRFHAAHTTAEETKVKVSLVMQRLHLALAKTHTPEAKIEAFLFDMPAIILGAKRTRTGVRAGKLSYPHAFVADLQRGRLSQRVKIRRLKSRLPLSEVSVNLVDSGTNAFEELSQKVERDFLRNFESELKYLMRA